MNNLGHIIDIIFGVIILLNLILGLWRGAIKEIFQLVGLVASIYAATRFYTVVGKFYISIGMPPEYGIPNIVGFISVFLGAWIVIKIISHIINRFIKKVGLSFENRLLGGFIGILKGGIIILVIGIIINYLLTIDNKQINEVKPKIYQSKILTLLKAKMPLIEKTFGKDSKFAKMFPNAHKGINAIQNKIESMKTGTEISVELKKNPENINKVLEMDEVKKLRDDPYVKKSIKTLLDDKKFVEAAKNKDYKAMISNPKLIDLFKDPKMIEKIKNLDLKKILAEIKSDK